MCPKVLLKWVISQNPYNKTSIKVLSSINLIEYIKINLAEINAINMSETKNNYPSNLQNIKKELEAGYTSSLVGAGFSKNFSYKLFPSWWQLLMILRYERPKWSITFSAKETHFKTIVIFYCL